MTIDNGLKRRQVHIHDDQIAQLDGLADDETSRAAHIRIAIKQYLERASRRQRRAAYQTDVH